METLEGAVASDGGGAPRDCAGNTCAGTARRRREQRQRQLARRVEWLVNLKQAAGSHHTAKSSKAGHGETAFEALRSQVSILLNRIEDLQLQITHLVRAEGLEPGMEAKQEPPPEVCKVEKVNPECAHFPDFVEPVTAGQLGVDAFAHPQPGLCPPDQASVSDMQTRESKNPKTAQCPVLNVDMSRDDCAHGQPCGFRPGHHHVLQPGHGSEDMAGMLAPVTGADIALQIETTSARLEQVNTAISKAMDTPTPPKGQVALRLERLFQLGDGLEVELRRLRSLPTT